MLPIFYLNYVKSYKLNDKYGGNYERNRENV